MHSGRIQSLKENWLEFQKYKILQNLVFKSCLENGISYFSNFFTTPHFSSILKILANFLLGTEFAHCALPIRSVSTYRNAQWANSVPKRKLAKFLKIEEIYGVVKKLGKLEIPVAQQNLKTEFFKICYFWNFLRLEGKN